MISKLVCNSAAALPKSKRNFMKKLSVFLAIGMAIVLLFAACDNINNIFGNNTDDSSNEGEIQRQPVRYSGTKTNVTYVLTVSPPGARSVAEGDDYVLVVTRSTGGKTSAGKFIGLQNNALVLRPSVEGASTFTVAVSGELITNITGFITCTDGTSEPAPGSFTTSGGGGGDGNHSAIAYTVTFTRNGQTAAPSQTVSAGRSIILPEPFNDTTISGTYTFYWSTNASGTGILYQPGDTYTPTNNTTFYGIMVPIGGGSGGSTPSSYTITFNINGGIGLPPGSRTVNAGTSTTIPDDFGMGRNGHIFRGWNTNSAGTGNTYSAGSTYTPTGNITFYAAWERGVFPTVMYEVRFDANGGTGRVPAPQSATASDYIILPNGSGLSKAGYTFGGWSASSAGTGTTYPVGSAFRMISTTDNLTFYARWNSSRTTMSHQ